jgi:hypothetical protein
MAVRSLPLLFIAIDAVKIDLANRFLRSTRKFTELCREEAYTSTQRDTVIRQKRACRPVRFGYRGAQLLFVPFPSDFQVHLSEKGCH